MQNVIEAADHLRAVATKLTEATRVRSELFNQHREASRVHDELSDEYHTAREALIEAAKIDKAN